MSLTTTSEAVHTTDRRLNVAGLLSAVIGSLAIVLAMVWLRASWRDVRVELGVAIALAGWLFLLVERISGRRTRQDIGLTILLSVAGGLIVWQAVTGDRPALGAALVSTGTALAVVWILTALENAFALQDDEAGIVSSAFALPVALFLLRDLRFAEDKSRSFDLVQQENEWILARELGGRAADPSPEVEDDPTWGDVERRLGVVVPADLRQLVDTGGGTEVKLGHTARARIWSRSQMRVPYVALEHGIVPFATLTTGSPTVFAVDLRRDDIQPVMRARIDRASELTALNFPLAEPLSEDAESVEDWIRFRLRTREP